MASANPLHQAAIVGVYNTKQARFLEGHTSAGLTLEAVLGALKDAGLSPSDVDGVCIGNQGFPNSGDMVYQLGWRPSWTGQGIGISAVANAALAIGAGMCETVVLASGQAGAYADRGATAPWTRPTNEFVECWGLFTAAEFALVAKRHMHKYGIKPEALAEIASAIRTNGTNNPAAVYYGRQATPEDVLNSRMVADPYHLLDICMTSEGGVGMVMTTVEKAKQLNVKPVYILGASLESQGAGYKQPPVWDRFGRSGEWSGQKVFQQSGLTVKDMDIGEFYDNFSWEMLRLFEVYGFCGEGEGGDYVMDGRVRIDGEFPIVTDGGLMSYSHAGTAQALQRVISGVLQIQGRAVNQVKHKPVRNVLVENFGSGVLGTPTMIIGAEPIA